MAVVSRLLAARAQTQPESAAFIVGVDGRALTWSGLALRAEHWRETSRRQALPPRARIGLLAEDPLAFTTGYLGALAAGLTAVPLDPRLTASELAASVSRLRVDVLATDRPDSTPSDAGTRMWALTDCGPVPTRAATTSAYPSDAAAIRPAVLLASSGTTGAPKGIPLSEWQLTHAAMRVARHHGFGPGERGYTPLPLFHVNAQVMGLLATLVSGASLVLDRRFDVTAYWDRVARWQPTWLNAVPAILASLADAPAPPERVVRRIRFTRSASAPLPERVLRRYTEHTGIGVLETYGMTEAAGQITANPVDAAARRIGSVGLPVGIGLSVIGPDGHWLAPGQEGMVALRGRQVVSHYLVLSADVPEHARTARDETGWLPTGDLGFRDEAGFVHLVGRADDVINRGGEKIHPLEVEGVLLTHPAVHSAAVVGAPHERLGHVAVAFVTARPGAHTRDLAGDLHQLCERDLARYKRPTSIEVTAELPTGPTGKVLRRALRAELATAGGVR